MACDRCLSIRAFFRNVLNALQGRGRLQHRLDVALRELSVTRNQQTVDSARIVALELKYQQAVEAGAMLEERIGNLEKRHVYIGSLTTHKVVEPDLDIEVRAN